jgi:hypothetical protein
LFILLSSPLNQEILQGPTDSASLTGQNGTTLHST